MKMETTLSACAGEMRPAKNNDVTLKRETISTDDKGKMRKGEIPSFQRQRLIPGMINDALKPKHSYQEPGNQTSNPTSYDKMMLGLFCKIKNVNYKEDKV